MNEQQKNFIYITLAEEYKSLFSEPDKKLTYTTKVVVEIRTNNDSPVYTRYYPYPLAMREFVTNEIDKLLKYGTHMGSFEEARLFRDEKIPFSHRL